MKLKKNIAVSDSGFVFDPTTGDSYSLNPIGQEILEYVKQGNKYDDINKIMTTKYDVDQTSFERYYYDFVAMLKQYQLIEENEEN